MPVYVRPEAVAHGFERRKRDFRCQHQGSGGRAGDYRAIDIAPRVASPTQVTDVAVRWRNAPDILRVARKHAAQAEAVAAGGQRGDGRMPEVVELQRRTIPYAFEIQPCMGELVGKERPCSDKAKILENHGIAPEGIPGTRRNGMRGGCVGQKGGDKILAE